MNTLLLQPTDVLFFRDGRPMGGASAGHGAAWPLPSVTHAALHAALWRSELEGHRHDHHGRGKTLPNARRYGSLVTAGPYPVGPDERWYYPRPLDLDTDSLRPSLLPASLTGRSSLPAPLEFAVGSTQPPTKDSKAKAWISTNAYDSYLRGQTVPVSDTDAKDDQDFSDSEATIGIGIDAGRGTQDGERFYSAHYLRLRDGWRLGLMASTSEKSGDDRVDLIPRLISASRHIIVGGQQRLCTATIDHTPKLPRGLSNFTPQADGKVRVKWVLLSPAVFPSVETGGSTHHGGWLPSWVREQDGAVLLRAEASPRGAREPRDQWRARIQDQPFIAATLVAALVPKPIPVTGWSLGDERLGDEAKGGAKPTHLAVPAGAVYYFACETADDARTLAAALNWHGCPQAADCGTTIKNRRSTLLGEKGFGLGVCGTWTLHAGHEN